jgi:hypothetical protein
VQKVVPYLSERKWQIYLKNLRHKQTINLIKKNKPH